MFVYICIHSFKKGSAGWLDSQVLFPVKRDTFAPTLPTSRTRLTTSASRHLPGRFLIIKTLVFSQSLELGCRPSSSLHNSRSAASLKWPDAPDSAGLPSWIPDCSASPPPWSTSEPEAEEVRELRPGQNLLFGRSAGSGPGLGTSPSHLLIYLK